MSTTLRAVATGLTADEAASRLARDGPNRLPRPPTHPAWKRLLAELTHFFAVMLWAAAALAVVAGMPQLGVAIVVVIVVNGVFAFVQEERAERAAARLGELLPSTTVVRRDGEPRTVTAEEVVVDDVLVLGAGDRVPADVRLVHAAACTFDESTLTGESDPVARVVGDDAFAGTYVVGGEAEAEVVAIGAGTRLAGIAELTSTVRRPRSPLGRELDRIVRTVSVVALGVGLGFFVLALLVGTPARDGFLFGVGVTVALVPEGLLPTVTLSLAFGAQRMAGRRALVRHLEAVETLGSTTFICTDKTGTLTQNRMSVVEVWTPAGTVTVRGAGYDPKGDVVGAAPARAAAREAADAARAASQGRAVEAAGGWVPVGDPMEAAVDAAARRLGAPADPAGEEEVRLAFDTRRRRESVVRGDRLLLKGAPDAVLPRCGGPAGPHGQAGPDGHEGRAGQAEGAFADMAGRGLRVLAVARRTVPTGHPAATGPSPTAEQVDDLESDLELVGLLGLEDPPRPSVPDALRAAREAGIRVAMITGDHPATARAIAREIGLLGPDELVVEGDDLPADDEVLGALLDRDGVVVSRVSPEQKLRVAQALQRRGHVVAMTGDGVNDGPALQVADIGVAMGEGGTDVARAAADLVLLDDDFATIVAAVEQGRATFANIRRFLTYHLTDNVAELTPFAVWALSGGRFPLALGVLQVLCLDIGTDLLPALALGAEAPSEGVLRRPPERRHLLDRSLLVRVFGVLGPTEALVEMTAFVTVFLAAGWRPGEAFPAGDTLLAASGAAFTAVVVGQIANAFACRSATRSPARLGWFGNRLLVVAVAVELAALVLFLGVAAVADLLEHAPPPAEGLAVALLAAPAVLAADAAHKAVRARRRAVPPG